MLSLVDRRTKEIGVLLPVLYLHGLAEGDFELVFRGLLGEGGSAVEASVGFGGKDKAPLLVVVGWSWEP